MVGGNAQAPRAAVICVNAEMFTQQGSAEYFATVGRTAQARLGEISQALGISFPVYVLFTRPNQENPDPARLAPKFVGERFALYRILPPEPEAPTIEDTPAAGADTQVVRAGPEIRHGAVTPRARQRRVN